MDEPQGSPADSQPNADQKIAELEAQIANLNKRYGDSSREAQRLAQQLQQAESRYNPQPASNRPPWEEKLDSLGVPVDAINQAIDYRAEQLVQQRFQPLVRGMQARQTMVGKYKDYTKFESDIGEMLASDPEVQQTYNTIFQADPVAAFDYAYLKLGDTKRRSHRSNGRGGGDGDMVEAQIPSNRTGDAHRAPRGDDGALQEAARAYRDNPNRETARAFGKAKLKLAISDDFLNQ